MSCGCWGQYQASVAGGRKSGMRAKPKNGRLIKPDGIAHSSEVKGKVDLLEAKHEGNHVTLQNFGTKSAHWIYGESESKLGQTKRYAQYARENPKHVDKLRYICNSKPVYDAYFIMREQLLPRYLRKYIEIELDPRASDI
jgi:hypothetical protein